MPTAAAAVKPETPIDLRRLAEHAGRERDAHLRFAQQQIGREGRALVGDERVDVQLAVQDADEWEGRRQAFVQREADRSNRARVVREPLTYAPEARHSFFQDSWAAKMGDAGAIDRQQRHQTEMRVELRERERRAAREEQRSRGDVYEFETRVNPNRSPGQGSSFAPPLWLIDKYATAPRPERCLANLAQRYPLPTGVGSINLPRLATGTRAQTVVDLAADPSQDPTDAGVTAQVVTVSGHVDVALQLLEMSPPGAPLDDMVFRDLLGAYDADLEIEVLSGAGEKGQVLGLLNAGGGTITYTAASPTAVAMYPKLGEVFGYVGDNRRVRAEVWIMRSGRWAWLATGEDKQERPLAVPIDVQSPTPPVGPIGTLMGNVPVYLSEGIPTNLGTGENQDTIIACRPGGDMMLWEGDPHLNVFDEVLSGTMQARISLHAYVAFIPHRRPEGICRLAGTGMVVPTNE